MTAVSPILPRISGVAGKLVALERRRDYLANQIAEGRGSEGSLQFARAEMDALESALDVMTYHRSIVDRLDTPLSMIRELVDCLNDNTHPVDPDVVARAEVILDEYGA